jgi:hypothetical protein
VPQHIYRLRKLDAEKFRIIDSCVHKYLIVLEIAIYIAKISYRNRIKIAAVDWSFLGISGTKT